MSGSASRNCPGRIGFCFGKHLAGGLNQEVAAVLHEGSCAARVGQGEIGIQADGFAESGDCLACFLATACRRRRKLEASQVSIERERVSCDSQARSCGGIAEQRDFERHRHGVSDLALHHQHVIETTVVGLGPDVESGDRVDELCAKKVRLPYQRSARGVAVPRKCSRPTSNLYCRALCVGLYVRNCRQVANCRESLERAWMSL